MFGEVLIFNHLHVEWRIQIYFVDGHASYLQTLRQIGLA